MTVATLLPQAQAVPSEPSCEANHLAESERRSARVDGSSDALDVRRELAVVAHELAIPLSTLRLSSRLLAEDCENLAPVEIRRMALRIEGTSIWLQELVDNLLGGTSGCAGQPPIDRELIDLAVVVEEAQSLVRPLLEHRGQMLRVWREPELPQLVADRRRLSRVVLNLLSNASKFANPGTPIDLRIRLRGNVVQVVVADRGPGLPTRSAGRLFEPFYRTSPNSGTGRPGLGLGLAIVKSIVEAHAGRVGAANRRGGGSSFWFELPVGQQAAGPSEQSSRRGTLPGEAS